MVYGWGQLGVFPKQGNDEQDDSDAAAVAMELAYTSGLMDPKSWKEAMQHPNSTEWMNTMEVEYQQLLETGTWKLVKLPSGKKLLPNQWVFVAKLKANGDIDKYKARLVICGDVQNHGIDYEETFTPVVQADSLSWLLQLNVTMSCTK